MTCHSEPTTFFRVTLQEAIAHIGEAWISVIFKAVGVASNA
jgi:hypothetical protein